MTCIVGVVHENDVYIGGDSSAIDGWNQFVSEEPKVFGLGEILIGVCGSHLVAQSLQHDFAVSRKQFDNGETDMHYLVTVFAKEVRQFLAAIVTKRDDDGEAVFAGGALFGYRGNLYRMSRNCQIDHFVRRFDAVGSGAPFALGAMAATAPKPPRDLALVGLRTAAELCCDVVGPFYVKALTASYGLEASE